MPNRIGKARQSSESAPAKRRRGSSFPSPPAPETRSARRRSSPPRCASFAPAFPRYSSAAIVHERVPTTRLQSRELAQHHPPPDRGLGRGPRGRLRKERLSACPRRAIGRQRSLRCTNRFPPRRRSAAGPAARSALCERRLRWNRQWSANNQLRSKDGQAHRGWGRVHRPEEGWKFLWSRVRASYASRSLRSKELVVYPSRRGVSRLRAAPTGLDAPRWRLAPFLSATPTRPVRDPRSFCLSLRRRERPRWQKRSKAPRASP